MPEFPIVDSHVHIYDVNRVNYGWLAKAPKINRTFLMKDFDLARGAVQVDKLVFVEVAADPGFHLREAAFVQEIASEDQRLRGMVAHAPVEKGEAVAADLDELAEFKCLRGVRRIIMDEPDQAMCLAPDFLAGLKAVGRSGLSFDVSIKHWGLVFAIELARRCPDVQFVLDHLGKPGVKHGFREPWWSQLRELAKFPNVVCKLSGLITEADHSNWTKDEVIPYIAHAIECFGFDRVMYGSDWTVSELTHGYSAWVAIIDEAAAGASDGELRQLYRETATRVYRL
jgi:L-fuconolactonase